MTTCDYNGWNDVPEDEREWFDQHPEIWLTDQQAGRPKQRREQKDEVELNHPDPASTP